MILEEKEKDAEILAEMATKIWGKWQNIWINWRIYGNCQGWK